MSASEARGLLTWNALRRSSTASKAPASSESVESMSSEFADQARDDDPRRARCGTYTSYPIYGNVIPPSARWFTPLEGIRLLRFLYQSHREWCFAGGGGVIEGGGFAV